MINGASELISRVERRALWQSTVPVEEEGSFTGRGRGRKPTVPACCIRICHGQIAEPLLPGIQRQTPVVEQL